MNKKNHTSKINFYLVAGIITFTISILLISLTNKSIAGLLSISDTTAVILKAAAVIIYAGTLGLVCAGIFSHAKKDDECALEENDERNMMIRGRAAENTYLLNTIIFTSLNILFIVLEYWLPAILTCASLLICNIIHIIFISHYEKKF